MIEKIIGVALAIGLIALFARVASSGFQSGGGGPANVTFGATQDLLSHDQKKAMEVIVKHQAGETDSEQASGESE